ncbi:hypothetical protein [Streptomyces sp. NPDC005004]
MLLVDHFPVPVSGPFDSPTTSSSGLVTVWRKSLLSDIDQLSLLKDLADQLTDSAERLPASDQAELSPSLETVLEDEVRRLTGLLNGLVSESAFRIRAGRREPLPPAPLVGRTTAALTGAADPVATALRDLGAAMSCVARESEWRRRPAGKERDRALRFSRQGLTWAIGMARTRILRAAAILRSAADTPRPNTGRAAAAMPRSGSERAR